MQKLSKLFDNSRFYILFGSILLSVSVVCYIRILIASDQLFYIRTEQIFGLLAIVYWYVALIISPFGYVVGKQRLKHFEFARRAIGVSAAYFAMLHFAFALFGQLGGPGELLNLPSLFKWSLIFGGSALLILLIMAATSFDKVVRYMTFKRWKWLHRLVYLGLILVVLHIWMVGTHVTYTNIQRAAFVALAILAGLETFRVVTLFTRRYTQYQAKEYFFTLFISIWILWLALIAILPEVIPSYHETNHKGSGGHSYILESKDA